MSRYRLSVLKIVGMALYSVLQLEAQPPTVDSDVELRCYEVAELRIIGNKRTRKRLFTQEMRLQLDSVYCSKDWKKLLELEQGWLYGTGLFDTVRVHLHPLIVNPISHQARVRIEVHVKERWYVYPSPIFLISAYSFRQWWKELNRDPSYISYGLGLSHHNLRGLNDRLSMRLRFGSQPALSFSYRSPDKKSPSSTLLGYGMAMAYASSRSIIYGNSNHLPVNLIDESDFLQTRFSGNFSLRYRSRVNFQHEISLDFEQRSISDYLHAHNNEFLQPLALGSSQKRRAFALVYGLTLDKREQLHYPLRGYFLSTRLQRYGLGFFSEMDITRWRVVYGKYISLPQNWYISILGRSSLSFPRGQAFVDFERLNRSFPMRGYQNHFIQGPVFLHANTLLKNQLFMREIRFKSLERPFWRYISYLPITVYGYLYLNSAWVLSYPSLEKQAFTDELLYGAGPGVEILTLYDLIFGACYAFTRHDHGLGIYLRLRGGN